MCFLDDDGICIGRCEGLRPSYYPDRKMPTAQEVFEKLSKNPETALTSDERLAFNIFVSLFMLAWFYEEKRDSLTVIKE